MAENEGNAVIWFLILGALGLWYFSGGNAAPDTSVTAPSSVYSGFQNYGIPNTDEIQQEDENNENSIENVSGTHTVEACSSNSGNCYDLEADINSGVVDTIHFDNGGYLDVDAQLDESGQSSGDSNNGDSWDITCNDCINN